jgi:hypothetical protein
MKEPTDYEVGFGKPPVHSQFKKGQSGNVRGRPKGKQNVATVLNNAIGEKLWIVENGKRRSITKLEAAVKQMSNKAAQGDSRALQQLISLGNLIGVETPKKTSELDADETAVMASLLKRISPDSNRE